MKRAVTVTFVVDVPVIDGEDDPVAVAATVFLDQWDDCNLRLRDLRVEAADV